MLQAEQALFPAEISLAAIRTSLYVSGISVYKAMGGGWVTRAERMVPAVHQAPSADLSPPSL